MSRSLIALVAVPLVAVAAPLELPKERSAGQLEVVHTFDKDMPTGVTVSKSGRIFLTFPRWGDPVEMNVGELKAGKVVPYPNAEINQLHIERPAECLCTVQSAIVDPIDRLWLCDTGTVNMGPVLPGGAKMICIDLKTDKIVKQFPLGEPGVLKTTYLNDLRFDLRKGTEGGAYVTDSSAMGPNGIVVIDLATGRTWRRLNDHPSTKAEKDFNPVVEGRIVLEKPKAEEPAKHLGIGTDGIALSHDGERLYYCPLASRHLYSVSAEALADPTVSDAQVAATVQDHGDRGFASDGLEHDADGRLYLTNYEDNAILRRGLDGTYETIAHDPRMLWPDTLSVGHDGYLYFTANQLHRQPRFQAGKDEREKPFVLFKLKVDGKPVALAR
jgi:sugar lactone lactonase YvrE